MALTYTRVVCRVDTESARARMSDSGFRGKLRASLGLRRVFFPGGFRCCGTRGIVSEEVGRTLVAWIR